MIMIPPQIEHLRFCKVKAKDKRPFESAWQNIHHEYMQVRSWVMDGGNYGVLCGVNGLIVIDCDTKELENTVRKKLPATFTVTTGSGGKHFYYDCPEQTKKMVLQNGEGHYGEVQSTGTQVIGPGSIHPNGKEYEIENDQEITKISRQDLIEAIKPYMKELKNVEQRVKQTSEIQPEHDINLIKITDVISGNFTRGANGELYGANPWHGSSGGMNFWINDNKNIAYCFRCGEGISTPKAIALNEGILHNCSDYLGKEEFIKTLKIAGEKYGLKKPPMKASTPLKVTNYLENAKDFYQIQPFFYDKTRNFWIWDKASFKWEIVDDTDMMNFIEKSLQLSGETVKSYIKSNYIEAFKRIGRTRIPKTPSMYEIQFRDKVVNVLSGEITRATPATYFCNPIAYDLGNSEETPIMDKIFTEWVGEDYVKTMYQIIAYSLLPSYPIHRIFCFIGNGLNGKSKYLELVKKFIGVENTTTTELDRLLSSRFEITRMHKKLLCVMGETNFAEMNKTSILKQLTGGDLIGFEYKGKKPFEDINYAKIIIATNNLPTTTDKTDGFYRRWMIIDFPNRFSEKKDIMNDIPEEEYRNLARRCIGILKDLVKTREFHNEGDIEERRKNFEEKSNPLQKFWEENVSEENMDAHISKRQFKEKLDSWCTANRFRKFTDVAIAKFMRTKIITDGRVTADWYTKEGDRPRYMAWQGLQWQG